MPARQRSGAACLERVYEDLDLRGDGLIDTASRPARGMDSRVWRELGDWLVLGDRVGAERIFFVRDDPVLVFSSLPSQAQERQVMEMYRKAWCMARPRCLFIAVGAELHVYGLDDPPVRPGESQRRIEPLAIVERAADVGAELRRFHRDRLESGAAFEDERMARTAGRADRRLLRDVRTATAELIQSGLRARDAHGLVERAILIRYLEDRGVLTDGYFEELAALRTKWRDLLFGPTEGVELGGKSRFVRALADRSLTFALFEKLARDFNGDLFVPDRRERAAIGADHLRLLRGLLHGTTDATQKPLFLWAYDFSVVPTSLVSSMYELFYEQEARERGANTHYTPAELVELVLADVLSPAVLDQAPAICDPACGSGIFLVEAYRRMVRHETARLGRRLSSAQLRKLLLERVAGCDIDESAVRLAAFSLYVAFLNYQSPKDILDAERLPRLIWRSGAERAPLAVADAFEIGERNGGGSRPGSVSQTPWGRTRFSVVVGNPPWTEPGSGVEERGERWARTRGLPVGDRSPSQLFIWRALDLLAEGGVAALLVSAKVLFNVRSKSFRARWLGAARLERVVNFSEVRHDFFKRGVAPFALVRFRHAGETPDTAVVYETARRVPAGRRGATALARLDRRIVDQRALLGNEHLWKTYSAGSHRDAALVARLALDGRLGDLLPSASASASASVSASASRQLGSASAPRRSGSASAPRRSGSGSAPRRSGSGSLHGYQLPRAGEAGRSPDESWRSLESVEKFDSWGALREEWLEPVPDRVKMAPDPKLFLERALLVRRFVTPTFGPQARLAEEPLAFRHTVYGIPLGHRSRWEAQVALGTVLSSLGRYWLYMVSGSWGTWKDEIRLEQLLDLPMRLDRANPATRRICAAVERLPRTALATGQLWSAYSSEEPEQLLASIDEAVAELFGLTAAERDLVEDFWAGRREGGERLVVSLHDDGDVRAALERYTKTFRAVWRPQLPERVELSSQLHWDPAAEAIAAVFETRHAGHAAARRSAAKAASERYAWSAVLERYDPAFEHTRAGGLLTYGVLRAVTDSAVVVVKRNERQLWSASAAREDAEATIAQAMTLQGA